MTTEAVGELWTSAKRRWKLSRQIGVAVAGFYLAWLFVTGFQFGIPQAAQDFLNVMQQAEQKFIGSWLDPFLAWIISFWPWPLRLEPHARYAFTLLGLKLLRDSVVDGARYFPDLTNMWREKNITTWRAKAAFALSSKNIHFLIFELACGLILSLLAAIAVSQFQYGEKHIAFGIVLLATVCIYEFVKAFAHVRLDLYDKELGDKTKGRKDNERRYYGQFFAVTCVTAVLSIVLTHLASTQLTVVNEGLLCIFIFIPLLSLQQFASAYLTMRKDRQKGIYRHYQSYGQVRIGTEIVIATLAMIGWILISVVYAKITSFLG